MTMSLADLVAACTFLSDGFAARSSADAWRLGAICILRTGKGKHLLVRKAHRVEEEYEFSGLWSFPGGMVRDVNKGAETTGASLSFADVKRSLRKRILAETGLPADGITDLQVNPDSSPLVSSYTAKGQRRYTLIVPFLAKILGDPILSSDEPSVSEVKIESLEKALPSMSPANSILAMRELGWDSTQIRDSSQWALCTGWALQAGVDSVGRPQ